VSNVTSELTHCKQGHDLREVGTYKVGAYQNCRVCHRASIKRSSERKAAMRSHREELIPEDLSRFMKKIDRSGDCWVWTGASNNRAGGYGIFAIAGRNRLAHRVSLRHFRGPFPDDADVDHLCRNTRCVNPDHLEAVSHVENMARGVIGGAIFLRTGACLRGHVDEYAIKANGTRNCRACARMFGRDKRTPVPVEPIRLMNDN
jgi:hypothetical protein